MVAFALFALLIRHRADEAQVQVYFTVCGAKITRSWDNLYADIVVCNAVFQLTITCFSVMLFATKLHNYAIKIDFFRL